MRRQLHWTLTFCRGPEIEKIGPIDAFMLSRILVAAACEVTMLVARYLCIMLLAPAVALGQSHYRVLHAFGSKGPHDGENPLGELIFDSVGNMYGTTSAGGSEPDGGGGTVFELSQSADGRWTETILYSFCSQTGCADGKNPSAGLVFDQFGNLYGTTVQGGNPQGCCWGTVFELSPPAIPGEAWTEKVLYNFGGNTTGDGCYPRGTLVFDLSGNLYGTASQCGSGKEGAGTLFELSPVGDGSWQETTLYNFCPKSVEGCPGGGLPEAGVTLDQAGNIFLTTEYGGGFNGGTVSEFSLGSNGQWTESVLHSFGSALGSSPVASVVFDQSGDLYGTAAFGETGGSLFRMTQNAQGWNYSALPFSITNGGFPTAPVLIDGQGSTLYGTTSEGGEQQGGTVYKAHGKEITALYSFCSQPNCADGEAPRAGLISDGSGHLYGTASRGGPYGEGVVFEIAP
jgi:uncharacterized repeat protein (TIGR03803 family)